MKFTDIFSFVVTAFTLLIAGLIIGQGGMWGAVLGPPMIWLTQAFGFGLLVVATTCTICRQHVRDLSPWTVFWGVGISGFVLLLTIIAAGLNQVDAPDVWTSLIELVAFVGVQIALFTLPRSYFYE